MNTRLIAGVGLAALLHVAPGSAAPLLYEISSVGGTSLLPSFHDPVADLLGYPAGANPADVQMVLRLVVDPDAVAYVENDNSTLQQVTYRDAVLSAEVEVNGVVFATLRRPEPAPTGIPVTADESEIEIINRLASNQTDNLVLRLQPNPLNPALLNSYTVPFDQTIGGNYYPDATIDMYSAQILFSGAGMLDDVLLPTTGTALNNAQFINFAIVLSETVSTGPFPQVSIGSFGFNGFSVSVTPVPVPPSLLLFAPLVGWLARSCRRR
ncbi:MAG: hypothetical protein H6978_03525 [Gammaproteobacteria bacterium]|nr:hypothetical protein [Gammaproteobacteria bacterium]